MATILLVEDDQDLRYSIKATLERAGHIALEAGSVPEGQDIFGQRHVDLVLTDLRLPGDDGLVLVKAMPIWGPRPPGWRQWVRDDHPDIVRAKQWSATILTAYRDAQALIEQAETNGEDPGVLIFRYEDLVSDPGPTLERILAFAELRDDGLSQHFAGSVDHARFAKRKDANTSEQLERMKPYLEPALIELGYTW